MFQIPRCKPKQTFCALQINQCWSFLLQYKINNYLELTWAFFEVLKFFYSDLDDIYLDQYLVKIQKIIHWEEYFYNKPIILYN